MIDTLTNDGDRTLIASRDTLASELRKAGESEACLIVVRGKQQGKRYELAQEATSLGRGGTSDIILDDPKVSRRQAIVRKTGAAVTLVDGGSTNGTYVNDRRLEANASVILDKEDMIRIGDTVLKYLPRGALEIRYLGLLEARANTDPLTRVFNRGYLLDALQAEFKRARALATPLSVLFLDIDHFKRINDSHGHDAGDQVLIETSALVRQMVDAERGVLGRFGGEEFVALLPGLDATGAGALAERIRATLENHPFRREREQLRVTASFGVASLSPGTANFAELIKAADLAVYRAKAEGRNRVCIS